MQTLFQAPHRRYNPLTNEWVLVSPHRTARPWQGQIEKPTPDQRPMFDPACYLCPTVTRANGEQNPDYDSTFVFTNDFAALMPATESERFDDGMLQAHSEAGLCRVLCFSPRHDLTLAEMSQAEIRIVIDLWVEQFTELAALDWINHVEIFENRGAAMGASNPHPHGQIWANASIPAIVANEQANQKAYFERTGSPLLLDYVTLELERSERIVYANEYWVSLVPFWAVWPFETLLLPLRNIATIAELTLEERDGLAEVLQQTLIRYDNLFATSFPYTFGWHNAPTDGASHPQHILHGHIYPPLLRSATVRKFMVGYEMLAQAQRDLTAESAAQRLRECSSVHWRTSNAETKGTE